jgi:hypothetical protein
MPLQRRAGRAPVCSSNPLALDAPHSNTQRKIQPQVPYRARQSEFVRRGDVESAPNAQGVITNNSSASHLAHSNNIHKKAYKPHTTHTHPTNRDQNERHLSNSSTHPLAAQPEHHAHLRVVPGARGP